MKKMRLNKKERAIEKAIVRGEFRPGRKAEFERIAKAIARRRKDTVLNIRVNSRDLADIKRKAHRMKVPYQTFISEVLHQVAG